MHTGGNSYHGVVTTPLTLILVSTVGQQRSPFDPREHGFDADWWFYRWGANGGPRGDAFSIRDSGEEIARALFIPGGPAARHVGLGSLTEPMELARFEVAANRRCQGLGTRSIDLIATHYKGHDLWVHSDADGFYERLGWRAFARHDKDESMPTMFVHLA